jgi:hypothetical protein
MTRQGKKFGRIWRAIKPPIWDGNGIRTARRKNTWTNLRRRKSFDFIGLRYGAAWPNIDLVVLGKRATSYGFIFRRTKEKNKKIFNTL